MKIDSLEELAEVSGVDGVSVEMEPGVYELRDYITDEMIGEMQDEEEWNYFDFAGTDSVFDFTGVTIEVDTNAVREELWPPRHTAEFVISGDDNVFRGLDIVNTGDGVSRGGMVLDVAGDGNQVEGFSLEVCGSQPYGYGDLLGKGGLNIYGSLKKHSGLRIAGDNTRVYDTNVFMRSFGHGFYIQNPATDAYLENCYVEGRVRSTNDMLAETAGPAYERDFESVFENREGEYEIPPGYTKSLAEDGFRAYGGTSGVTCVDCVAKHMRSGFSLRPSGPNRVINCRSMGCERGIWVGPDSRVRASRADVRYGPALMVEGDGSTVDMEVAPVTSDANVHATAVLGGSENDVRLVPQYGSERRFDEIEKLPIKTGFHPPLHGEITSPIPELAERVLHPISEEEWGLSDELARNFELHNETPMPVELSGQVTDSRIETASEVIGEQADCVEIVEA